MELRADDKPLEDEIDQEIRNGMAIASLMEKIFNDDKTRLLQVQETDQR